MSCCLWCNSVWAKGCHGNKKTFSEYGACLTSAGRSLANNSTVLSRDTQFVHGRNKDDKTVQNTSHLGLSTIGRNSLSQLNTANSESHPCAGARTVLQFAVALASKAREEYVLELLQHGYIEQLACGLSCLTYVFLWGGAFIHS